MSKYGYCEHCGYTYRSTERVAVPLRITSDLRQQIRAAAKEEGIGVNQFTVKALHDYLTSAAPKGR